MYRAVKRFSVIVACSVFIMATGCGKAGQEYDKAVELMESGKYEDSLEHLETAIKENSEKAEYYITCGMVLNNLGCYKEAEKEFEKAYQDTENKISGQNNKQLYLGQAIAYMGQGEYNKAIEACDKAVKIDQYSYLDVKFKIMKASIKEITGDTKGALEVYNDILEDEDGQITDVYTARGSLYLELGEEKKALDDFSAAAGSGEKCYDAYFAMYNIYMGMGDNANAEKAIKNVTDIKAETAEEMLQLGKAYYYKGDYTAASSNLDKSLDKGCKDALYYLGMVLMAENDYTAAVGKFQEYISSGSRSNVAQAYNQAAGCYIELEDFISAESYIDKGLGSGISGAYRILGKNQVVLYERMKKYKKARNAAEEYLQKYPGDTEMQKELLFINTRIETVDLGKKAAKQQ